MARRNSNGEGTIYRRKDERWEGAVYVLTTSGKRKRLRVYGNSRAEVHSKLIEAKARQNQGIATPDKVWKLGDYFDYWLEQIIRPNRRPTTYEAYEIKVRCYLKPDLGHYTLAQLSIPILQSYLNQRLADGQSRRTVHMLREVLSSTLTSAMRQELIGRNVARLVMLPGQSSAEVVPWTVDEATQFLSETDGHWLQPAFILLVLYGLRRGEVLGLRWQDVDFARQEIRIQQQIYRANGVVRAGPVKTAAGQRKLPLLGLAQRVLLAHQKTAKSSSSDLIFTAQKSDDPIGPQTFTRAFQRLCEGHGLRRIRLHDIRHTTATLLKNLGVPARDTQLILGHSNVVTTQQIYQHGDMNSRRHALERLEILFDDNSQRMGLLPSKQPSTAVSALSGDEKRRPLDTFFSISSWLGRQDSNLRMLVPKFESKSIHDTTANFHTRVTQANQSLNARRQLLFLGVVAVNLAVKNNQASYSPEKEEGSPDTTPAASINHH